MEEWIEYATSPDSDDMPTPASEPAPYKNKKPKARVPRHIRYPGFEIDQILAWADAHYERTGKWPTSYSGRISEDSAEKWSNVNNALQSGLRGLSKGYTLATLLAERRGKRNIGALPPLQVDQILAWADSHYARTGKWPCQGTGVVSENAAETWQKIDRALLCGMRGLPGGSSLARLLADHRRKPSRLDVAPFHVEEILAWADAYYAVTGKWPSHYSGRISENLSDRWSNVDDALRYGSRGLPGGSSLAGLLAEHRGKRNIQTLPPLRIEEILAWADAHFAASGSWPAKHSGPITGAPGETWMAVQVALVQGKRGLPGGSSLPKLLAENRNRRHRNGHPLNEQRILEWADAHHARTGKWPTAHSGAVMEAPGEKWSAIDSSLKAGCRGLNKCSSLARLIAEKRDGACYLYLEPLTEQQILDWADANYARLGKWPTSASGEVTESPGENWGRLDYALIKGARSLPGGSSVAKLLAEHRGARNHKSLPPLDIETILRWADQHFARHTRWPTFWSGPIEDAPGETWNAVDSAFKVQGRGLIECGYRSLAHLLDVRRGKLQHRGNRPGERILHPEPNTPDGEHG